MTSKELNLKLVRAIPGIAPSYQQEVEWQEGDETGSHVVYEDVLAPYIRQAAGAGDRDGLDEIFGFIEQLLETGDGYAEEDVYKRQGPAGRSGGRTKRPKIRRRQKEWMNFGRSGTDRTRRS